MKSKSLIVKILFIIGLIFTFAMNAYALSGYIEVARFYENIGTQDEYIRAILTTIAFSLVLVILFLLLVYFCYGLYKDIKAKKNEDLCKKS